MEISMSTNQVQESARIYQFPAGGRAALGGQRYDEFKSVTAQTTARVNEAAIGSSWYHEDAIREAAERARDH
jgi:hypothetical protein